MTRVSGDDGYTLVEVLVAIVIMGVAFVSLLGALRMSIIGSDYHKQQSQVEAVLGSAAENVKAVAHVACAQATEPTYIAAAQAAATATPPGWAAAQVQITDIKWWDGTTFNAPAAGNANCYDDAAHHNLGLQLITITVTNPGTRATQSMSVEKR